MQFHPEVLHSEHGQAILRHFLYDIAGARASWTEANIIDGRSRGSTHTLQVGGSAGGGLSGGVDSPLLRWCSARWATS